MKLSLGRRQNTLIGIVVGIAVVGAMVYATGLSRRLLAPFGSSAEYKSSESGTAPELAAGDWINSEPLKLKDLLRASNRFASRLSTWLSRVIYLPLFAWRAADLI